MKNHDYNFAGGNILANMGASWFVSYSWYCFVNKNHKNWLNISTYEGRISSFKRSVSYHNFWLQQIAHMSENKLSTNKIGLSGSDVIYMAKKLLDFRHISY